MHVKEVVGGKPEDGNNEIVIYNLNLPYKPKPIVSCIYPKIVSINQICTLRIEID